MQRPDRHSVRRRAHLLPAALLVVLAFGNRVITNQSDLSPWELGGFGMFSTIDSPQSRLVLLEGTTLDGERLVLEAPAEVAESIQQLRVWPTLDRTDHVRLQLESFRWARKEEVAVIDAAGSPLLSVDVVVGRIAISDSTARFVPLHQSSTP